MAEISKIRHLWQMTIFRTCLFLVAWHVFSVAYAGFAPIHDWEDGFSSEGHVVHPGKITCFDGANFLFAATVPISPTHSRVISLPIEVAAQQSLEYFAKHLGQNLRLRKKLAHGSFAHVFLVQVLEQIAPGSGFLAMKVDHRLTGYENDSLAGEFQLLSHLHHPNLIKVFHYHNFPIPAFLMEYVDGLRLDEVFSRMRTRDITIGRPLLIKWKQQLEDLAWYLANNNVAHFDLKSDNIMIDRNNNVKLLDFNISISDQQRAQALYEEEIKDIETIFSLYLD